MTIIATERNVPGYPDWLPVTLETFDTWPQALARFDPFQFRLEPIEPMSEIFAESQAETERDNLQRENDYLQRRLASSEYDNAPLAEMCTLLNRLRNILSSHPS